MSAQKYKKGQMIKASYWTAVYKRAIPGWREERVEAVLEVQSPGKARVVAASMERAGSKRQQYNTTGVEMREIGKVKIISKLSNVRFVRYMPRYTLRTPVQDLPPNVRSQVRAAVRRRLSKDYMPGSVNDLTERAMDSRLCDLEDTINVHYYLNRANEPRSKGTGRTEKR